MKLTARSLGPGFNPLFAGSLVTNLGDETGESKGFGFVGMTTRRDAKAAMLQLNGHDLHDLTSMARSFDETIHLRDFTVTDILGLVANRMRRSYYRLG